MRPYRIEKHLVFLTLSFLIIYSSSQFILILRHKSPYLSDSYFYKHIYYQFQGMNFDEAQSVIRSQVSQTKLNKIEKNIFFTRDKYENSYKFFVKRPFYPYIAYQLNNLLKNDYLSFLLPIFISYITIIIITFYFFKQRFNLPLAAFGSFLFISFYPFLDWSTYFLTDTIGAFFWMLQVFFIYKYFISTKKKWLIALTVSIALSLLNREQNLMLLLVPLGFFLYTLFKGKYSKEIINLLVISTILSLAYLFVSFLTGQKNFIDTVIYTMNNYGFYDKSYGKKEILIYLFNSYRKFHIGLGKELFSHHIWLVVVVCSFIGFIFTLRKIIILDMLILFSAVASYTAFFAYPVLSYRYFFPVIIAVCYFAMHFAENYQNFTYAKK